MKGLLLIPAALALAVVSGCSGGLREDLGVLDGHHREVKHRIDKVEAESDDHAAAIAAMDARVTAAQASADDANAKAEVAKRIALKALHQNSKK